MRKIIALFSLLFPLWLCLLLMGCLPKDKDIPDRSHLPKNDLEQQAQLSQQRFGVLVNSVSFEGFSEDTRRALASYGIATEANAFESAYQRAVQQAQQHTQDEHALATTWSMLDEAWKVFLRALHVSGGHTIRFAVDAKTGLIQEAPIFSDWMLHQQITDPTTLFIVTKKTAFNLKNDGEQSLGLPTLARVSVNNPLDIPLNEPLDPRSLHVNGDDQNIFLIPLSLDQTSHTCKMFASQETNPKNPIQWPPLARADAFSAIGEPVLKCYRIGDGTRTEQALPSIRADVIHYTQPSTKQTTPVLRISPLAPLAENTRYLLVLGEGIRTANQQPLKRPTAYFKLLANVGVTQSHASEYVKALHALAQEGIETITHKERPFPVFASSFTTVSPNAELQRLIRSTEASALYSPIDTRLFPSENVFNQLRPQARKVEIIEELSLVDVIKNHKNLFPEAIQRILSTNNGYLKKILTEFNIRKWPVETDLGTGFGWPEINVYLGSIELPYALNQLSIDISEQQKTKDRFKDKVVLTKVPFILVTPKATAPEGGWPLVIYQHGVLSDRINALFPGIALASLCDRELDVQGHRKPNDCYATLAIDLPLHGVAPRWIEEEDADYSDLSRQFTYKMLSVPGRLEHLKNTIEREGKKNFAECQGTQLSLSCKKYNAWSEVKERHFELYKDHANTVQKMQWGFDDQRQARGTSGTLFVNPGDLLSVRDRLQQGAADLLNLTASIGGLTQDTRINLNKSKVHFIGHSLGTIIGANYAVLNQQYAATHPEHPQLQGVALLTPGGGISRIMERSSSFRESLFSNFQNHEKTTDWMPGSEGWETFALATQTLLDSADPITHAKQLIALPEETRINHLFVAEMAGGAVHPETGIVSQPDTVIPNSAHLPGQPDKFGVSLPSYFAGTEPLIAQLKLKSLYNPHLEDGAQLAIGKGSAQGDNEQRHWVARLNQGNHFSPILPFDDMERLTQKFDSYQGMFAEAMEVAGTGTDQEDYDRLQSYLPLFEEVRQIIEDEIQLYLKLYAGVIANFTHSQMTVDLGSYLEPAPAGLPFTSSLVESRLFKPLPLFRCNSDHCVLNPTEDEGLHGIQSVLKTKSVDNVVTTEVIGTSCPHLSSVEDNKAEQKTIKRCQYQQGKKAQAKWRFQIHQPGVYRLSLNIPNKLFREGSNCIALKVLSNDGYSQQIRVNQVPARTTVVCRDAQKVEKDKGSTDIVLGEYLFSDSNQVYAVIAANQHNPDVPDNIKAHFSIAPMILGSLTLTKVQVQKTGKNKRSLYDRNPQGSVRPVSPQIPKVFSVDQQNPLSILSNDPKISVHGTFIERMVDIDGNSLAFLYVDSLGGNIQFRLVVHQPGLYQIRFDKRPLEMKARGSLDGNAAMRLSINGLKGSAMDHRREISISKDSEAEQQFIVKLLQGEYQFTLEAHGNQIVDWGAYFSKMDIEPWKHDEYQAQEGWEPLFITSGEIAWTLNLKQQGINKPFVREFDISNTGLYQLLVDLPGGSALGTCGMTCGYEHVVASLVKFEENRELIIRQKIFNTYKSDFVRESIFRGRLTAGRYRLKISTESNGTSIEDYHHLSFKRLEVIKETIDDNVQVDHSWQLIRLPSGKLKHKNAWILNLKQQGIDKSLQYDFDIIDPGQYRLLVNLPGNNALGACQNFSLETCGYRKVEVSIKTQDGKPVGEPKEFDTYNNNYVDAEFLNKYLEAGAYQLVVRAKEEKDPTFEDYHHLSFERLKVQRVIKASPSTREGWQLFELPSGQLQGKRAWTLNLEKHGIEKPLQYHFDVSKTGRYQLLVSLPGNTALGNCSYWSRYEACGYSAVEVSLQTQSGKPIGEPKKFDTFENEYVGAVFFNGDLEAGTYQLTVRARAEGKAIKDHHHLSFERLEIIREE